MRASTIAATYLFLLALLIPWYWPADQGGLFLGFPLWAIASLAVLFLISLFTAWLCLRDVGDEE